MHSTRPSLGAAKFFALKGGSGEGVIKIISAATHIALSIKVNKHFQALPSLKHQKSSGKLHWRETKKFY